MSFQKRNLTLKIIQRLKHLGNEMTISAGAISSTVFAGHLADVYSNNPSGKDIWNALED